MLSLEEERAIKTVLYNYCWGVDRRDWPLFKSCFASDFVADYAPFGTWTGPDAMVKMMQDGNKNHPASLHSMSNTVIEGAGDSAKASSHVHAILMPLEKGGAVVEFMGIYEDVLAKISGTWKMKHRRFILVK